MGNVFDEIDRRAFAIIDGLDKLNTKDMSEEDLKKVISLTKTKADILRINLDNAKLRLEVIEIKDNFLNANTKMPEALGG